MYLVHFTEKWNYHIYQFLISIQSSSGNVNKTDRKAPSPVLHACASSNWNHMASLQFRTNPVVCLGEILTSPMCPGLSCLAHPQKWIDYTHALGASSQCHVCCILTTLRGWTHWTTADSIRIFQLRFFFKITLNFHPKCYFYQTISILEPGIHQKIRQISTVTTTNYFPMFQDALES